VLLNVDRVLKQFRTGFIARAARSFLRGSFRHGGDALFRPAAPPHPGGAPGLSDAVMREAYSHEVSSAGFCRAARHRLRAFYSYAYPEPAGFRTSRVAPDGAVYNEPSVSSAPL